MPDRQVHPFPSDDARERPRILAIAGTGQNGSTLVSRLLGELPASWRSGKSAGSGTRG